jgi:hypothetical protein
MIKLPENWRKEVRKITGCKVLSTLRSKDVDTGKTVVTDYFLSCKDLEAAEAALLKAGFVRGFNDAERKIGPCLDAELASGEGLQCFLSASNGGELHFRLANLVVFC